MSGATLLRRAVAAAAAGAAGAALWTAARPRRHRGDEPTPDPPENLPPARIVAVPGHGELFVRESPAPAPGAPTVLLLHGWMFPADLNWATTYGPIGEVARVIAVDHRGHGRGPRPAEPFRLVDVADDVAALVRHLGADPVIAVGYSMGGPVAQLLWQRHPDVVAGLVLCATAGTFSMTARDRWTWRLMGALQVGLRLAPRDTWQAALARQARGGAHVPISRMITPDTPDEVIDLLPWIIGEVSRGSAEDLAEAGRELGRYDARGWLPSVDVPTAVLVSTRDRLVPPDRQRHLVQIVPGAVPTEIDMDHDGPIAAAERFVPALRDAIRSVHDAVAERIAVR